MDWTRTLTLLQGGLFDAQATWRRYLEEENDWRTSARLLTGPLIIGCVVLQILFSELTGGWGIFAYPGVNLLLGLILGLLMAGLSFLVLVAAFWFVAGLMQGNKDFDRAFAAVTLALIPSYVASAIAGLVPWIGSLIGLVGFIVSLVYLWRIMPLALEIPEGKRTGHYVLSLGGVLVINLLLSSVLVAPFVESPFDASGEDSGYVASGSSGLFASLERQGRLTEAASADNYDPPEDGKVSSAQVERLVKVVAKKRAAQQRYSQKLERDAEKLSKSKEASLADLGSFVANVGTAFDAHNAELEIVKTSGGNWAEHQWVKNQLRVAALQQGEGSQAIEHNFALLQRYEDQLNGLSY